MNLFVEKLYSEVATLANSEYAKWSAKYMKNLFIYFGIKSPARKEFQQKFLKENTIKTYEEAAIIIKELWNLPEREMQYFAIDIAVRFSKKAPAEAIELYEYMLTEKSWWDSVDSIAATCLGAHFKNYPEQILPKVEAWMASDNMWLQRTALLFQLKYKKETNTELMYELIRMLAPSKEFFIRKAIGWVLREYSKTNPESVREFLQSVQLSGLSVREGSKYI